MSGNWDHIKDKQLYFVEETNGNIIKFVGFDNLEKWVKEQKLGKEWTTFFVSVAGSFTKK